MMKDWREAYLENQSKILYKEYKNRMESDERLAIYKKKVKEIASQSGKASLMNDIKWCALLEAIWELPFPPPFFEKRVTQEIDFDFRYLEKPRFYGDWTPYYEEGLPPFFDIEWIYVNPKYYEHVGKLLPLKVHDETILFQNLLERLKIPYKVVEGYFLILGYC